jgi:hypothetical protein
MPLDYEEAENNGKSEICPHIESIMENPKSDFMLEFYHKDLWVHFYSHKAIKELIKLIPTKVDRDDFEQINFGKMYPISMDKVKTDKYFQQRKDMIFKKTNIKRPGDHVQTMMEEIDKAIVDWKEDDIINVIEVISTIALRITAIAIFDKNYFSQVGNCRYIQSNGEQAEVGIVKMMQEVSDDLIDSYYNPMTHHCPFLNKLSIGNPFRRDKLNIDEIHEKIKSYLYTKQVLKVSLVLL